MKNYTSCNSTAYSVNANNFIGSIHTNGKEFFALLPNWKNEVQYFEISEDLKEDISNKMDDDKIVYLEWENNDLYLNKGVYRSKSFKISAKDFSDEPPFLDL